MKKIFVFVGVLIFAASSHTFSAIDSTHKGVSFVRKKPIVSISVGLNYIDLEPISGDITGMNLYVANNGRTEESMFYYPDFLVKKEIELGGRGIPGFKFIPQNKINTILDALGYIKQEYQKNKGGKYDLHYSFSDDFKFGVVNDKFYLYVDGAFMGMITSMDFSGESDPSKIIDKFTEVLRMAQL